MDCSLPRPALPCVVATLASLFLACGPAAPPETAVESPARVAFENPGGMWMPEQLPAFADTLRALGITVPVEQLADPTRPPLAASVWLGGCSASFVSPRGLIVTNHHCVQGALQFNATPEHNLVRDGFAAASPADELTVGPTGRAYVVRSHTDVTAEMLDGTASAADPKARYEAIEAHEKAIVARCEEGHPELRCRVVPFYEGARYVLFEQLALRDVRLVYAPPEMVGSYGGDIDNWMWPRHSGDFAFLRAYVGPDGQPADYAADNVPFVPAHYLPIAREPLRAGDVVMVAGYPRTTGRLRTAHEVAEAAEWQLPHEIAALQEYIAVLDDVAKLDAAAALQAHGITIWMANSLKKDQGMLEGLVGGGLAEQKRALEAELRAWIGADPSRAGFGEALEAMAALQQERSATRERDEAHGDLMYFSQLLRAANVIVRLAEERAKPDDAREPGYQERDWQQLEQRFQTMSRRYDRRVDRAVFRLALQRAARLPVADRPAALGVLLGDAASDGQAGLDRVIDAALDAMYEGTVLEDEGTRLALLHEATPETLATHPDPFIRAAVALRPLLAALEERDEAYAGAMAALRPRYAEALLASAPGPLSADANGTLRVTFGTVRGFRPRPDAEVYHPFTYVEEMVAKHTGELPFDAPKALLDAVSRGHAPAFACDASGRVVVDFLSDVDTTGGNSGSPTLNGRGELVGLLFDGNYESMASDLVFMPEVTRAIHTDMRYVLWVLDVMNGAAVLRELGITSADPALATDPGQP